MVPSTLDMKPSTLYPRQKDRLEQKSSVKQLFTGGDLLAVVPTGFGKSLIFHVLALAKEGCVVIVIKRAWKAYATPTSRL